MGLTGSVSLEVDGNKGRIVGFVLSCGVMGRKIAVTMLYTVIKYAKFIRLRGNMSKIIRHLQRHRLSRDAAQMLLMKLLSANSADFS
jgi:predicted enzyme involved in methoxymalonyl-ACP biosynthesis